MARGDKGAGAGPKLIKILLQNQGEDQETPWAEDLGPARGPRGSRKARLVNVPFLHAKPTLGDVVVVEPAEDGFLTWDRAGVPWSKIGTRIAKDGKRHPMIVDYKPKRGSDVASLWKALLSGAQEHDVAVEGCFGPDGNKPGRAYLAVPEAIGPAAMMKRLAALGLACEFIQVHPAPRKRAAPSKKPKRKPRAKA